MEHTFVKVDTIERPRADGPRVPRMVDRIDIYQCHACDTVVEEADLEEAQQTPCPAGDYIIVNTTTGPKVRPNVPAMEHSSGLCSRRDTPVFGDTFYHFDD